MHEDPALSGAPRPTLRKGPGAYDGPLRASGRIRPARAEGRLWTGLVALVAGIGLFGLGIAAYLSHVHASATALVKSAQATRTTADAEREIAAWRTHSGKEFWVESRDRVEKAYEAQIVNEIARLGFVELTELTLDITMHEGNLRRISVTEWTAWYPLASASIQEWFEFDLLSRLPNQFLVSRIEKPTAAVVIFPSSLGDQQGICNQYEVFGAAKPVQGCGGHPSWCVTIRLWMGRCNFTLMSPIFESDKRPCNWNPACG